MSLYVSLLPFLSQLLCLQQDVVLDLMNQTRDLRCEQSQKDQCITQLSEDMKDITVLQTSSYFSPFLSWIYFYSDI